jgi:c-di-GMP-related signal transduction protein
MVGADHLRHVATLVAPTATEDADESLMLRSVRRAKLLSSLVARTDAAEAYMVGLVSVADDVYGVSMSDLLAEITLGPEATSALLDRTGEYGNLLTIAEACERGDHELLRRLVPEGTERVEQEYAAADAWARARRAEITAEPADPTLASV